MKRCGSVMVLLLAAAAVRAEDRLHLEGTAIVGNKELPNVLYIVPWKEPELVPPPSASDTRWQESHAPIEREVLLRQLQYRRQLEGRR